MLRKAAVATLAILVLRLYPAPAQEATPPTISANQIIIHLTRTIAWYQHVNAIDDGSSLTENALLRSNAREFAKHALQYSFDFARAQAGVLSATPSAADMAAVSAVPNMQQSLNKATDRVARLQQRIQGLDARIDHATGAPREALTDERVAIAADLALAKQMEAAVKTMASFNAPKSGSTHGLIDVINSLENLNPSGATPSGGDRAKPTAADLTSTYHPENAGIVVLASKAIGFYNTSHHIDLVNQETIRLAEQLDVLRTPLRKSIRGIIAESDAVSSSEDSAVQPAEWLKTGQQISELSSRFKQLSSVAIPMGEAAMSLQSVRGSLDEWRKEVDSGYASATRYLMVRLAVLLGGVLFILLASAIWQRAIDHYAKEPRRRRQLLLVKRVFTGLALALLLTFGFFSSLASIATLLGFVTAGLALALQNVILSAVAYFFLIGRYGLRVGDRITVQGVTGEVIEVGFIRLFMMEMVGTGTDLHPTGRLAVFANSVIFQPAALMKQAPGLDYTWHAVTVTVENPDDYQKVRARLTEAVTSVFEDYRLAIEQQHKAFEKTTQVPTPPPEPNSHAQFTDSGLEVTIRYPVSLSEQPGHIDERIMDRLIAEAETEPRFKFTASGSPKTAQVS